MKKYLSFAAFALLTMSMTFSLSACGDDDEDDLIKAITSAAGTADNPQTPNDPEGTVTVNIRNQNNGNTRVALNGICTYIYDDGRKYERTGYLRIDESDNFKDSDSDGHVPPLEFVSLGKVNGLAAIKSIPQSGWSEKVAVIPGYGYVVRSWADGYYHDYDGSDVNVIRHYARLYVVDYMESTGGAIIGAIVKYQSPWVP